MATEALEPERTAQTACPLDCPDSCSVDVTLKGGRVTALDGNERNPLTASFLCGKVRGFTRHLYGEERIAHPFVREPGAPKGVSGGLRRASWDEALGRIVERVQDARARHGGESILPLCYGGSNGALTHGTLDARFFRRVGASHLLTTVCAAPTGAVAQAMTGRMAGMSLEDYEHAKLIVLWGVNPHSSGIHLVPPVMRALERGAKLVVVDPRRTKFVKHADLHLAPKPGTDLPLALAIVRWLVKEQRVDRAFLDAHTRGFERLAERAEPWTLDAAEQACGVPARDIERLARLYADASPAALRCGWGLERNRNGGSAVAAVLSLPAIAGKMGVRGGGFTMSNKRAWPIADLQTHEPAPPRAINQNKVGRALTEPLAPPIELVFVYNHNPAETLPDARRVRRGLGRADLFTVVFDQVWTRTALYADVVLPATTFLEHDDLARGYGAYAMQRVRPVVEPVGEARSNVQVFGELLERLDLASEKDACTPDALVDALLVGSPEVRAALGRGEVARPPFGDRPVQMVDVLPNTPDRRIDLFPAALNEESPVGLYVFREDPATREFPLALISPSTSRTVSSTFGQLHRAIVPLTLNPEDAQRRGIADGDTVRVFNELGEVRTRAHVSAEVRPGVAFLPKGLWAHHTLDGHTSNDLVPDALTDVAGGAVFNDARVEVERVA